jgi:cell division protein FtsN
MLERRTNERGNTLVGFIIGLVVGLAVAVSVALVVTKTPIPFVNKLARPADKPDTSDASKLPDPNKPLYSKDVPADVNLQAPSSPAPYASTVASGAVAKPVGASSGPANALVASNVGTDGKAPAASDKPHADPLDGKPTFLQAGAYRTADDADGMRAKLALLGFDAAVSSGDQNGATMYRVRLGPYLHMDDLNRVRQRLTENGVDVSLVAAAR